MNGRIVIRTGIGTAKVIDTNRYRQIDLRNKSYRHAEARPKADISSAAAGRRSHRGGHRGSDSVGRGLVRGSKLLVVVRQEFLDAFVLRDLCTAIAELSCPHAPISPDEFAPLPFGIGNLESAFGCGANSRGALCGGSRRLTPGSATRAEGSRITAHPRLDISVFQQKVVRAGTCGVEEWSFPRSAGREQTVGEYLSPPRLHPPE